MKTEKTENSNVNEEEFYKKRIEFLQTKIKQENEKVYDLQKSIKHSKRVLEVLKKERLLKSVK